MESVSTGVLDENKDYYLRSKDKAEKLYDVSRHIQLHMSEYKKMKIYYPESEVRETSTTTELF